MVSWDNGWTFSSGLWLRTFLSIIDMTFQQVSRVTGRATINLWEVLRVNHWPSYSSLVISTKKLFRPLSILQQKVDKDSIFNNLMYQYMYWANILPSGINCVRYARTESSEKSVVSKSSPGWATLWHHGPDFSELSVPSVKITPSRFNLYVMI